VRSRAWTALLVVQLIAGVFAAGLDLAYPFSNGLDVARYGPDASALDAIRRASPFPPIPESLKDLANEPMIIRFEVAIRVRS